MQLDALENTFTSTGDPIAPEIGPIPLQRESGRNTAILITNIPTPYRIPLFNELAAAFAATGVSLKIVFAASGYERRQWVVDLSD